ncbi:MAG: hypothetical protein GXO14_04390 [Thermococci archaeon]|nr:hypothetical protein [Thermococci archaeon]
MRSSLDETVETALFEARPYVENYEKLKEEVLKVKSRARSFEELVKMLEELASSLDEPFRTDVRIFLQKLETVR